MTLETAIERLARAEASVAHLERQYDELNEVVITQGKLLARIQKRLEQLGDSMESQELERIRSTNSKPPHYSA
ncbi:MAG: SlyX family protein [Verrucomicrobia bacterium]|nr:MAG: SlyX family protein [Verrucomicrobiota bacterium]